jgi:hypothetical protein
MVYTIFFSSQMHFSHDAWIVNQISCDSPQISWGQCPRVPGKKNTLVRVISFVNYIVTIIWKKPFNLIAIFANSVV